MTSQRAFSLLEMCITLAIVFALTMIALPALRQVGDRTREGILLAQLLDAIGLAGQEARIRGVAVTLCQSENNTRCENENVDRLLVFVDVNKNGIVADHEQILAVTQIHAQPGKLYWRAYPYYREHLQFFSAGLQRNDNGSFWYCDSTQQLVWAIMLSKWGKTRVLYPNQKGEIKDAHGAILHC